MAINKQKMAARACNSAHVLHDGLVDMLYALLPLLREAFGLTYAEVGLIRAVHKAATAAFQIPIGMLSEKTGARSLLVIGTVLAGIAFLGLSFATGFEISGAYPSEGQRTALGIYNAFGDIGKFVFLGTTILATAWLGFSWQTPVISFGVIALIMAGSTFVFLNMANAGGPPAISAKDEIKETLQGWGIKHKKGFLTLGVVTALDNSTRNGFLTFAAFLMIEKGVSTEWAAAAVLVTVFGGMCGKFAVGVLAERIGISKTIALTEFATAGLIVLVIIAPSLYAFFLLPFLGIFLNGTSSAIYGTVPDLIEGERHSRAYGLIYTLGSICGLIAPLAYGYLADVSSITTTMYVVAGAVLLTVPLCGTLARSLKDARGS